MNLDVRKILTVVGIALCFLSVSGLLLIDVSLNEHQIVTFTESNGDQLIGTYYPGSVRGGILLLEGFGSDQTALRSLVAEFHSMGMHVFTFDFSGHGQSPGSLTFDNAATDRLANQVLSAKEQFKTLSGLTDSELVLFGYSMGARVALQAEVMDSSPVAGLVLFGAQVNLAVSAQSEFFTGVVDSELAWVQALNYTTPPVDILILTGSFDDILPPVSAELLYTNLTTGTAASYTRELTILPNLVHNYEIYSPEAISLAKVFISERLSLSVEGVAQTPLVTRRIVLWIVGVIGVFLVLVMGNQVMVQRVGEDTTVRDVPTITDQKRFLKWKLILWLAAVPVFLVLAVVFFIIPIGVPVFNIVYVGFIGSYGIVLLFLYSKGRVRGTEGRLKLDPRSGLLRLTSSNILLALTVALLLTLWCILYARSGIFNVFPLNDRLVWLILFTAITSFGFYVGQAESQMIGRLESGGRTLLWNTLIGFLPFFFLSGFWYALGSLSGMIGSLQGLLILALVVVVGGPVQHLGRSSLFTAVFQSFLLQLLILPTGALFIIM